MANRSIRIGGCQVELEMIQGVDEEEHPAVTKWKQAFHCYTPKVYDLSHCVTDVQEHHKVDSITISPNHGPDFNMPVSKSVELVVKGYITYEQLSEFRNLISEEFGQYVRYSDGSETKEELNFKPRSILETIDRVKMSTPPDRRGNFQEHFYKPIDFSLDSEVYDSWGKTDRSVAFTLRAVRI